MGIPTTRKRYKEFKEIMDEKVSELERLTKEHWVRDYNEREKLYRLYNNSFDAIFDTDVELYECVYGMIRGLEFKN